MAQTSTEVVQPLPPEGVNELNEALRRLARNSRNVSALIDAGDAALRLNDTDAAIGFYGRADELSPGNARVKMGLASAYVRRESPLQALRLFNEAERAGVSSAALAGDRGLAYDLVGDTERAQKFYYQALTLRRDDEVTRRLALSQAIAGDRKSFEATLLPLLRREDLGAFRIRSFGLAILGEDKEAIKIAEAVMPRNLSRRLKPYLRYMDRLTPAQQAAAVHFGNFPQTAQIGQDDPRIASYSSSSRTGRTASAADRSLTPQGEPLGPRGQPPSEPNVTRGRSEMVVTTLPRVATAEAAPEAVKELPASAPVVASVSEPIVQQVTEGPPSEVSTAVETALQAAGRGRETAVRPSVSVATTELKETPGIFPDADAGVEPKPVLVDSVSRPATPAPLIPPAQNAAAPTQAVSNVPTVSGAASVADAFADFNLAPSPSTASAGGVDITAIKPAVEAAEKAAPEPAKPTEPRRFWVQIATGKDRSALRFDWRRLSRKAPNLLGKQEGYLASWNQTNRLVTGPFKTLRAARDFVTELGKADVDSFTFTSAEGEKVDPLS
ncbi:SPOR domain-containing protein [Altererythrobacter sp. ZODW24]|uniref:SPOR domain-containing protein n=1 Tax=Altererythrobacter sp. ZODW24 TaxID=2185142 RepID=UPI0013B38C0B|nr:SPOR domain-containing protein [Altererythrobacter sp. ZODW24]